LRLANGRETVDLTRAVLEPVEGQDAPRTIPAEERNEAVAVPALPDGTNVQNIVCATTL